MKLILLFLFSWAVPFRATWAQEQPREQEQKQEEQQQERQQEQQPQKKPTLGPPPAPSLGGPRSATTTDGRKLLRVRAIFVERMDNSLSDRLTEGLTKTGRFRVVADRKDADAVLRGTCFDSRRLKSVHSEVYLADRGSGASIWSDSVRRPFNPPPLEQAVNDSALDILAHLSESIKDAQRR